MAKQCKMAEPNTTLAAPTFSFNKKNTVIILAGPDKEELIVHESCISHNSDYFKKILKEASFAEGQTRAIELIEDICLETLKHYLNYAYSQKLPTECITAVTSTGLPEGTYELLGKLYVLGERMLDSSVRNAVIKEFVRLPKPTYEGNKAQEVLVPNLKSRRIGLR